MNVSVMEIRGFPTVSPILKNVYTNVLDVLSEIYVSHISNHNGHIVSGEYLNDTETRNLC